MTIQQLKCLCATVQCGNFSTASEQVFLTQSTVSKNIISLEQQLGIKLLERQGRTTTLTENGKKIMPDVWDIMSSYAHLSGIVSEIHAIDQQTQPHTLRLCSVPVIDKLGVMKHVNQFLKDFPQETIELSVVDEHQVLSTLNANNCDIAFCSDIAIDTNLFYTYPVCPQSFYAMVSPDHPLAQREEMDWAELEPYTLVFPCRESMLHPLCVRTCEEQGFNPRVAMTINRPSVALEYIQHTDYVYVALGLTAVLVDGARVKSIALTNAPNFHFVLARRKDVPLSAGGRKLIEYLCHKDTDTAN